MKEVRNKYKSVTHYLLMSLIPYTHPNVALTFRPNRFLSDIINIHIYRERTIRNAYYSCVREGLVVFDGYNGQPVITEKGLRLIHPFCPKELKGSKLMIVFDIPEAERWKRNQLRVVLRQLKFVQVQKSVWITDYDVREYIEQEVKRLKLSNYIKMFQALSI